MPESRDKPQKREIPQLILETGLSADYGNEFIILVNLKLGFLSLEEIAEKIRKDPIKKYSERYSIEEYDNLITDQNRDRIKRLDEIVDVINSFAINQASISKEQLLDLHREAINLIKN